MTRICLAQINPTVGDLENNFLKIVKALNIASRKGADIVIFPQLVLTGYPPEDLLLHSDFINACNKHIKKIVPYTKNITVLLGAPHKEKSNLYNSCYVIQNRRLKYIYKKIFLPNYAVFDEKRYFVPGNEIPFLTNKTLRFTITICEDMWARESPLLQEIFSGKAHLIFNLSASPFYRGKFKLRQELACAWAFKTKACIVYCNLIGAQDELVFDGRSFVISPQKRVIAQGKSFEEDLLFVDVKISKPILPKDIYASEFVITNVKLEDFKKRRKKCILPRLPKPLSQTQEVHQALVLGIKDYVSKNGFKKAVVGLSGGIDSSLTCVLACDALGKENVIGVSMPSQYSSSHSLEDAKKLADNLGIKFYVLPIEEIFESYRNTLNKHLKHLNDTTFQNIQARIRGNILMAFSNNFGWIVLTTGNKSEMSVGYCTLYGDTAGGFGVLKDVTKNWVYKLARYRNKISGFALIPSRVLKKPPSAELKPNQTDEQELGPYKTLDKILDLYIEKNLDLESIVEKGFSPEHTKKIIRRIDTNEYKRRQSPPGIKITPRSFGKDRRMPITNRFLP